MGLFKKKKIASRMITLIFSSEELDNIIKIIKSLEDAGLLVKSASKTDKNKVKQQKEVFHGILGATLGASLLENMLSGKEVIQAAEGVIRAGQDF